MIHGTPLKKFALDLKNEISNDNVANGAAALAYYLMLAIFPLAIFLLSLLPYLPIADLQKAIMDLLNQALPPESAKLFTSTVTEITSTRKSGLLSLGAIFTVWAASNGLYAIMQQLNITYDVTETRPFWKVRGTALLLTLAFVTLVIGSFALIIFGGTLQEWLAGITGWNQALLLFFAAARWLIIAAGLLTGIGLIYYLGPNVKQRFRWISPGAVFGVLVLGAASFGFKIYVTRFGDYNATYGSIGAVIVLMLWLYLAGWVLLLGSEINSLIDSYASKGSQGLRTDVSAKAS